MSSCQWPLGRSGDGVYVVIGDDVDLLTPILDGEPEREDGTIPARWVPLGIPDLDVDPEALAEELKSGPADVWLVMPCSDRAYDFRDALTAAMGEVGFTAEPVTAFLPKPLTLADVVERLPSGRDAAELDGASRYRLLSGALRMAYLADADNYSLGRLLLAHAGGQLPSELSS